MEALRRQDAPMKRTAIKAIAAAAMVIGVGLPATAASAAPNLHLSGGVSCTDQMPASVTSLPSQCGVQPVQSPIGAGTLPFTYPS
jgi:hypothetical protein